MTKAELDSWKRNTSKEFRKACDSFTKYSAIKNDPCAPKPKEHVIITDNPYATDKWKTQRAIYQMMVGAEPTPLQNCVKETIDYVYNEWARYQENDVKKLLEYGRRTNMDFSFDIENIREALIRYGYVTNCEVTMSGLDHAPMMHIDVDLTGAYYDNKFCSMAARPLNNMKPKKVIFDGPATIIHWFDGTKTIVKCKKDEIFDPEKGLAMAICKRLYGKEYKKVFKMCEPAMMERDERTRNKIRRQRKADKKRGIIRKAW